MSDYLYNDDVDLTPDSFYANDGVSEISDDATHKSIHTWTIDNDTSSGTPGVIPPDPGAPDEPEQMVDVTITINKRYIVHDYTPEYLLKLHNSGAKFYAVYTDETEDECSYTDVYDLYSVETTQIVLETDAITRATNQHFWYDSNGAHVTDAERDVWTTASSSNFSDASSNKPYHNILMNSLGIILRSALTNLLSISRSGLTIFDGVGNNVPNVLAAFTSSGAVFKKDGKTKATISAQGLTVFDNSGSIENNVETRGAQVAFIGVDSNDKPYTRIGKSTKSYIEVGVGSDDYGYVALYSNDTSLAHFGYGSVIGETGSSKNAPYYTIGKRKENSVIGEMSLCEGADTTASAFQAHAEGYGTTASGTSSHSEGQDTIASGHISHAEGDNTSALGNVTVKGSNGKYYSAASHAEGIVTTASGAATHSEGFRTFAGGDVSLVDESGVPLIWASHAEGFRTTASGQADHSEGESTTASGGASHAEGYNTTASGLDSHAEGKSTTASSQAAHSEGELTTASGTDSHAEGYNTIASGLDSHAEGCRTKADGLYAHAEGQYTVASGGASHASGVYTVAQWNCQMVCGIYNRNIQNSLFEVGNGSDDSNRKNAFTVLSSGSAYFNGTTSANGTAVTSDARIKTLIENLDFDKSSDFIKQLKPKHYYKNGVDEYGFYAQDIEIIPEFGDVLVTKDNSGLYDLEDYRLLNYQGMIAPIVAAIQGLLNENSNLKSEIVDLKKENKDLKERLEKIEEYLGF